MLEVRELTCGYGQAIAAEDVSFLVDEGSVTAMLGPNGAGKSSVIMSIAGHLQCWSGAILMEGEGITHTGPINRTRQGVAIVPEGRRIFPDLSVAENLLVGGYLKARSEAASNENQVLSLFPRLAERYRQRAGTLSGGEQQMLAIGRALMTAPKVLLVDELSLGLMVSMVDICIDVLKQLRDQGVAILLVEQNTARALDLADYVVVLSSGRVVYAGSGEETRANPENAEAFLDMT